MSIVFLLGFVMVLCGEIPAEQFDMDCFYLWALFSIADAFWLGGRK